MKKNKTLPSLICLLIFTLYFFNLVNTKVGYVFIDINKKDNNKIRKSKKTPSLYCNSIDKKNKQLVVSYIGDYNRTFLQLRNTNRAIYSFYYTKSARKSNISYSNESPHSALEHKKTYEEKRHSMIFETTLYESIFSKVLG